MTVKLKNALGKVFDSLDARHSGSVASTRLLAFTGALREGCEQSDNEGEREAVRKFINMIEGSLSGKIVDDSGKKILDVTRQQFLTDATKTPPGEAAYTAAQADNFVGVLSTILDNEEALEGLLEAVNDSELETAKELLGGATDSKSEPAAEEGPRVRDFREMMRRLFDEVLDEKGARKIGKEVVNSLATALQRGCEHSEDENEKRAMMAFVEVLLDALGGRRECPREAWIAYAPRRAMFSDADGEHFTLILMTILNNAEARQGLMDTMKEIEGEQ